MPIQPVLLVHGGAWAIPDDLVEPHRKGVQRALAEGWRVLERGGSCLDAVEEAVVAMEDDDTFDAGRGSFLTSEGKVQLDALIMDGATLRAGGVGCVERLRNPIRVARKVLEESPHVYLVGEGAERFAAEHGVELCANEELIVPREIEHLRQAKEKQHDGRGAEFSGQESGKESGIRSRESAQRDLADSRLLTPDPSSHDTIGAVALDRDGNLAAATSTGGTLNKTPGRVGDSSLIGCGCYADNESGAVSATGWGEPIMKLVLGKWAVDRVRNGTHPQEAAQEAIYYLHRRLNGHGGLILLDARGRIGFCHNTPRMAWAWQSGDGSQSGIERRCF